MPKDSAPSVVQNLADLLFRDDLLLKKAFQAVSQLSVTLLGGLEQIVGGVWIQQV